MFYLKVLILIHNYMPSNFKIYVRCQDFKLITYFLILFQWLWGCFQTFISFRKNLHQTRAPQMSFKEKLMITHDKQNLTELGHSSILLYFETLEAN